jgi:hypothetical protein
MRQTTIGWREWVSLPELGIDRIKAKVDTGARTSALHAHRLRIIEDEGREYAEFRIRPVQRKAKPSIPARAPIVDWRKVRSSSGKQQLRPVIATAIQVGDRRFRIEITLAGRDEMGFRMLLGRTAIRGRFLVDPGHSFLAKR